MDGAAQSTWTQPKHDDALEMTTPEAEDEEEQFLSILTSFLTQAEILCCTDLGTTDRDNKCVCVSQRVIVCAFLCAKDIVWAIFFFVLMRIIPPVMGKGCTSLPHTALVAHKHWSHRWTCSQRLQKKGGWNWCGERNIRSQKKSRKM